MFLEFQQEKNILKEKKYKQKIHKTIENKYDLTLFYQGIENLQLSKKMFTRKRKNNSTNRNLYKINALDMQDLVKQYVFNILEKDYCQETAEIL